MATIQVRVDDKDKKVAEKIFEAIGIDMPTAIRAFLKRINLDKEIPFPLSTKPKKSKLDENGFTKEQVIAILRAEKEAEKGINVSPVFDTAEEMIEYLHKDIEDEN